MFSKVLITSRGLIQTQTIKAVQELGAKAVVLNLPGQKINISEYIADEVYPVKDSNQVNILYDRKTLLEIAKSCHADAVHPGYGFLAEDLEFATELKKRNICFISAGLLNNQGLSFKYKTKEVVSSLGIKTTRGSKPCKTYEELKQNIRHFKYPLILKPEHGVGADGVVIVHSESELEVAYRMITILAEAHQAITKDVIIEEYLGTARQIEFPVLRDKYGNVVVLPEIECSIQRRFNPLLIESPVPNLNPDLIKQLRINCKQIVEKFQIIGLLYIEFFIVNNQSYCNGINCSIQPSCLLSYETTGFNILKHQIQLMAGEKLDFSEQDIQLKKHGIGISINAEDPDNNFIPSTGKLENDLIFNSPGIAIYKTLTTGDEIPSFYEPQVAHVVSVGDNRRETISKLKSALWNFVIEGVKSNLTFLYAIINSDEFKAANYNLTYLQNPKILQQLLQPKIFKNELALAALIAAVSLQNDVACRQKLIAQHKNESLSFWNLTHRILNR
ncbi:MAG: ATP-grasp domain-containing protein [Deltaproteobacteria bacterium]|jgi:pyruvate carboxylase subunit A|nr:ATP-grasp domain-containing protein [Deltaproteobacteria bacterium]